MLLNRFAVFMLVASVLSAPEKRDAPNDCPVGEVKSPLSEDERLDTAGLYILLEGAQCNGSLVSWHTCGFFNPLDENVTSFQMLVEVYRENVSQSRYTRVRQSREDIYLDRDNDTESQGCVDLVLDAPFDILEGDLIAVEVSDQCENDTLGVWRCPLQPNLNATGDGPVFYRETRSRSIDTDDLWDTTNWVNASINIKASIFGITPSCPSRTVSSFQSSQPDRTLSTVSSMTPSVSGLALSSDMPPVPSPTPVHQAPNDCSVGEVKSPLSEDERLNTAGLYILLEEAKCNGSLVSWHMCGFFNPLDENVTSFQMLVEVYRENVNRSRYTRVRQSTEDIYLDRDNDTESQGCVNLVLNTPFDILEGDLIAVEVSDQCDNDTLGVWRCPLQPNLNTTGDGPVFYRETTSRSIQTDVLWETTNWVNVSINIKASIIAPYITPHNVMSTRDFTATVIPTFSDEAMLPKSVRGGDIQPGEIAGITIGILALALLLLAFTVTMYVYCRHVQKKKGTYNYTSGSVPVTEFHTNDHAASYPAYDNCTYSELSDSAFRPEYVTADQKSVSYHTEESSDRERFRNRQYSDLNAYSIRRWEENETSFDEPGLKVPDSPHYEFDSDPQHELKPSEDTPHYEVSEDYGDPYWEPANREDELKLQLARLQVLEIPPKDLKLQDYLGSGQFGTVNRGQWCVSEREVEVAVKSLPAGSTEDERVKFLQEAAIMGQFKHPNILRIHGVLTAEEPLMIVCEMMHKGDLHQHLKLLRPNLSSGGDVPSELPAVLLSFCRQVAFGMGYLAGKSFVHRDLAARNILVSKDDVCKIADFGLSRDLQDEDFYTSHGGKIPVKWTAPEALNYRKYSSTSDVWSYGILLYEIWALGYKPYRELTNSEALQKVLRGYRLPPPSGCPRTLYKLMLQCWHSEPESRPSFFEILLVLQRPDFQLLRWSPEDKEAFSEQARTLGGPLEDGKELYNEMQTVYSTPPASSQTL